MYLVIKEIKGKGKNIQTPLRIYENAHNAFNYVEQYMQDSSGEKWHAETFNPNPINNKFITRQRWYRKLKNNDIEKIKIQYMKLFS